MGLSNINEVSPSLGFLEGGHKQPAVLTIYPNEHLATLFNIDGVLTNTLIVSQPGVFKYIHESYPSLTFKSKKGEALYTR